MRTAAALSSLVLVIAARAQSECSNGRYTNYSFFDSVVVTSAVPFGANLPVSGIGTDSLYMDVFEPHGDTLAERPVVLVGFGGSFITGSRADVDTICRVLARLGYVAVAYDYRVGFFWPSEETTVKAVMRCVHDARACIRSLRRSAAEDGNPFGIDTARIIIGGVSAGAVGAAHVAYLDQASEIPEVLFPDTAFLGGIEGTSGSPGYSSDVIACWSMSGAIGDTSWIVPGDQPFFGMHEWDDAVVPCWTEEVEVISLPTGLVASGDGDIQRRLDHVGVENCVTIYPGGGHVGYVEYDTQNAFDKLVDFLSDVVCGEPSGCALDFVGTAEIAPPVIELRPFPVPATSAVSFQLEARAEVTLSDLSGRVVHRVTLGPGTGTIDLSDLPAGPYLLRVVDTTMRAAWVVKE